jgi:hypothetical protein
MGWEGARREDDDDAGAPVLKRPRTDTDGRGEELLGLDRGAGGDVNGEQGPAPPGRGRARPGR